MGLTRRGFLSAAVGTGAAMAAGCLDQSSEDETYDCNPEQISKVSDDYENPDLESMEQVSIEEMDEDFQYILEDVEEHQHDWVEGLNQELYETKVYDPDSIENELYVEQDSEADNVYVKSSIDYFTDIQEAMDEAPRETEITMSTGLERITAPTIGLPVFRKDHEDTEDPEIYDTFLERIEGIQPQINDERGNTVESYVPRGKKEEFANKSFETCENSKVYKGMRQYMEETMEIH